MKNIKFVELFAGIGGFRYGLEKANSNKQKTFSENNLSSKGNKSNSKRGTRRCGAYRCVWANEWDKYAAKIYEKNFDEKPDTRDIRTVEANEIPDHDLLTAGFPCQAFSIAGRRKGFEDTRGTLFFDIARILNAKRPRFLFLENVRGLLSHDEGRTFKIILSTLDELGYDLQWQVLNSKDYGVPQNRERVFIVGHIRGTPRPKVFPIIEASEKTVRYYQGDMSGKGYKSQQDRVYSVGGIMGTLPATRTENKCNIFIQNPKLRDYKKRKIASSLIASQYKEPQVINCIRRLTPIECERLQGFPDGWTVGISDTQRYKCLGNAVTTNVVTEIGRRLINETYSEL